MAGYLYGLNHGLFLLSEKYSEEEITLQINNVILNREYYRFYIIYPVDEIGECYGHQSPNYYELSANQLSQVKRAHFAKENTRVTVTPPPGVRLRSAQVPIDYLSLLGCEFYIDKDKSPGIDASKSPEWASKSIEYADEEALKLYKMGMRRITHRTISPKVALRFEKDEKWSGSYLDAETIRRHGLKGWKFCPPRE